MPEVGERRLVDTCSGADDVDGTKVLLRDLEHLRELSPLSHVGLLEERPWHSILVGVDELLGLGTQREVCEDDIGAALEKETGEFEVDA